MTIIMNPGAPMYPTQQASQPARAFTPGVGGYGIIKRTGEGDPRYYGDYTPSELARLGGRVDARTPVTPGTPLAAALASGQIRQYQPSTGPISLNIGRSNPQPGTPLAGYDFNGQSAQPWTGYQGTPTQFNTPAAAQWRALQAMIQRSSM